MADSLENFLFPEVLEIQGYFDMESFFGPYAWDGKAVKSHWSYGPYDYASPAKSVKGGKEKWDEVVGAGQAVVEDEVQYSDVEEELELPEYIGRCPEPASETSSNRPLGGKGNNPYGSKGSESCDFCRRRKGKVHLPHFITPLI